MKSVEKPKPKCISHQTWLSKYPPEDRETPEVYWKYLQKRNQNPAASKLSRPATTEPVASYYSSASSYKPHRNYTVLNPAYLKYASVECPVRTSQNYLTTKENRYPGTAPQLRKNRYDTELEENEKTKYSEDEAENFTEGNAEDDGEEEDEQEDTTPFPDRDYEEHEADDEIDEESDAPPQTRKINRTARKEQQLVRSQPRWNGNRIEQQQGPRRIRYQQVPLSRDYLSANGYYQNAGEREASEPPSEEEFATPVKLAPKRQPVDYNRWIQSRSSIDRRELLQAARKARTKPEAEHFVEAEFEGLRQCARCGSLTKKPPISARHRCRLEENLRFPANGPIGGEPEIHGRSNCGRCVPTEKSPCQFPAGSPYTMKPRRSREVKSPIYESVDQPVIEKTNNYTRQGLGYSPRDTAAAFPEKPKRSVHTTHAPTRLPCRYAEFGKQTR